MSKKQPVITEKEANLGNKLIIAGSAIAIVAVLLFMRNCHSTNTQITIPAVSGKFDAVKPAHTPITANSPQLERSGGSKTEQTENELLSKLLAENEKMKCDFEKASDSLKLIIYNQAIQLNNFTQTFDDENITATASGIVRGEIQSLKLDYTVKEKKIDIPKPKETVFRLLGGVEAGNTTSLDNFAVKGNLMFQNKRGNLFSASFDTKQMIWVGYSTSIFNIKN